MARSKALIPELSPSETARPALHLASTSVRGGVARGTYESIRAAILDCTFPPGMALSEQTVSDELHVSRAPVREAFRQLAVEGLLEAVPQRGTFVARLDRRKIADAIFVREAIECQAAALAAAAPLAPKRELSKTVQRQVSATGRGDYKAHLQADEDFHHCILVLAGHPHAWNALRLARTGMNRIRHLAIPTVGSPRIAIDHHKLIVKAIVEGDAKAAKAAMRTHIRSPLTFLDAIQERYPHYFEPE